MVLVSGIGYSNLSDMSFGRVLLTHLMELEWPAHVHVEDLNYGPIMILQWLEASPTKYKSAIFISAAKRGREGGKLEAYTWNSPLPDDDEIQARIEEAVTGVISLDNLLIICKHFGVLPDKVTIIEVEPVKEDWGLELTPAVAARVSEAIELVRREVSNDRD